MVPWHGVLNDQNLIAAILQYLQVVCYLFSHLCYHKSFAAKTKSKYMCPNSRIKHQQLKICKGGREPGEKAEWRNGALWKADLRLASFWDSGWGCPRLSILGWQLVSPCTSVWSDLPLPDFYPLRFSLAAECDTAHVPPFITPSTLCSWIPFSVSSIWGHRLTESCDAA